MNNVLIIGGSGFIGSNLTRQLCLKGYKVAVLVRKNSNWGFIKSLKTELRYGDLLDLDSLNTAFKGIDTIFCAVNIKPFGRDMQEYENQLYQLNTEGTKNLIAACKLNGIRRVIYFSSVAVMGYQNGVYLYDEFSDNNPVDAYGKAKLEAENILNESSKKGELDITVLRPPGVFGEMSLGAIAKIISFVRKGFVPVIGSGRNRQSIAYLGNIVNQAIYVAQSQNSIGKTYIIGDSRPYSINELISSVCLALDKQALRMHIPVFLVMSGAFFLNFLSLVFLKRKIINKENIIAISTERIFDTSKIFKDLGCSQEYDLKESIARTVHWYNENSV